MRQISGMATMQVLIESLIVVALITALFPVTAGFAASGRREDVKLQMLVANISALETIKQAYYETGSLDSVLDYSVENNGLVTRITSVQSVVYGDAALYRIAVDSQYNGVTNRGTELITYVSAR